MVPEDPAAFHAALRERTRHAWVTSLLVAINVAVLVAMTVAGSDPWSPAADDLVRWGANYGPRTTMGEWWRLLTGTFVHAGAPHLVMNIAVLMQIGPLVERLIGNRAFAATYLVAGLCGAVASIAWNPYVLSVGASGAVFGVFGVLLVYLLRYRSQIAPAVLRPVQRSAAIFIALNIALGLLIGRIDLAAHLAGLIAGVGAGLVVARPLGEADHAPVGRPLLVLTIGLALVATVAVAVPRVVDIRGVISDWDDAEYDNLDRYNAAARRRRANEISDADLAKIIDSEVLPFWHQNAKQLGGLRRLPSHYRDWVQEKLRYIGLRQRAWSTLSDALRNHDHTMATESAALHVKADEIARSRAQK